jgi:hypothetical protein
MPIVAAITRASASRFFSQQGALNLGNSGGNAYTLRKADGTALGTYRSVSEAQAVFNRYHGPNRIYRWERRDLRGDVEQHVCIGTPLNAGEVWVLKPPNLLEQDPGLTSLQQWMEPQWVPNSVKLDAVSTGVINTINDVSGSGNKWVANDEPRLIGSDPNFKFKQVVDFDGVDDGFTIPNLGSISPPYTVILVANSLDAGGNGILWETQGGDELKIFESGISFEWRFTVGAAGFDSGVLCDENPAIIVAKVTATETVFRVNGAEVGTIAAVPDAGTVEIGGFASDPWEGRLAFHMIANIANADDTRILQTERYLRENF